MSNMAAILETHTHVLLLSYTTSVPSLVLFLFSEVVFFMFLLQIFWTNYMYINKINLENQYYHRRLFLCRFFSNLPLFCFYLEYPHLYIKYDQSINYETGVRKWCRSVSPGEMNYSVKNLCLCLYELIRVYFTTQIK